MAVTREPGPGAVDCRFTLSATQKAFAPQPAAPGAPAVITQQHDRDRERSSRRDGEVELEVEGSRARLLEHRHAITRREWCARAHARAHARARLSATSCWLNDMDTSHEIADAKDVRAVV
jgi:hypothetical protein